MILESIVTTLDDSGNVNIAPMGPTVDHDITRITLRPFRTSKTYANLLPKSLGQLDERSPTPPVRCAVVHVSDDAMLFAQAAVDQIDNDQAHRITTTINTKSCRRLKDCHRWFAVRAVNPDQIRQPKTDPRATIECEILEQGVERPFFGFNRAKHAVIEAAILATRTHLLDGEDIQTQIDQLQVPVEKTGGKQERDAFAFLQRTITTRLAQHQASLHD
jgi:hypothetical protein